MQFDMYEIRVLEDEQMVKAKERSVYVITKFDFICIIFLDSILVNTESRGIWFDLHIYFAY